MLKAISESKKVKSKLFSLFSQFQSTAAGFSISNMNWRSEHIWVELLKGSRKRWNLDQRVIRSREVPIEVQYESLGTYHEIYAHYLIMGNRKKEIRSIYIRTTLGHISFYREIEEAIQGFSQAYSYTT